MANSGNGTREKAGPKVPGSEAAGANGVEVSKDGKWLYVAAWGSQSFASGTVAIPIGNELWVGSFRGDRIAIFPASK